ncbi:hypothetical protein MG290_12075 [Flavobacterium sp. CBA20B-1]|uniref:hypothetical protein n=1 Tax=unclassified Flavobacterium TaxID=196869 RepID=UPI00222541F5|nr:MULTISPECIES: hypothetical protein [unclassified Flavobacterium]WCM41676.1 hypothetical protein MG290_12075 [Flavobacterium sp. CBA20B-1]
MKIAAYFFLFFISVNCFSQNNENYFKLKIEKVEQDYRKILNNRKYIIYSTPYKMHLLFLKDGSFYNFIFKSEYEEDFVLDDFVVNKSDDIIQNLFNSSNYEKGVIDFNSHFYIKNPIITSIGLSTYFSLNDGYQSRYCEYFLTIAVKPVPMNLEIYQYLSLLILNKIN